MTRPSHQGLERWKHRTPTTRSNAWANASDVAVRWRCQQDRCDVWIGARGMVNVETDSWQDGEPNLAQWSGRAWPQDGWLDVPDAPEQALHLHLAALPPTVTSIRCLWAWNDDARPLAVCVHVPARLTLNWDDVRVSPGFQRLSRVWNVDDGAVLRCTTASQGELAGALWWDDVWNVHPHAGVVMVDALGDAHDARRRTRVELGTNASWRMASVGWLLPQRWHEHDLDVQHLGENSLSVLHHRGALLERSQRRMTSCVRVDPRAHASHTEQTMQHWLLHEKVTLSASPQLAIGVGTVSAATHGAAVGRFDAEVVQAMRARGLPLILIARLLLEGSFEQAIEQMDDGDPWWTVQRARLTERLSNAQALQNIQDFWNREMKNAHER